MYLFSSDCKKAIIRSDTVSNPDFQNTAHMVLTEGTEVFGPSLTNYWLSPNRAAGSEAQLVLDLGCEKMVNGFYIRNTHQAHFMERGTKDFSIYMSETSDGSWKNILTGTLENAAIMKTEMTFFFFCKICNEMH